MILDTRSEFISKTAIPAAGTAAIGDVIDTQSLGVGVGGARDLGNGQPLYWYVSANEAAVGGTSVIAQLVSSDSANLSSPVVHAATGTVLTAALTAGAMLHMQDLPLEGPEYKRYLGLQLIVAGTYSSGTLSSGLTLDKHGWKAYPKGAE